MDELPADLLGELTALARASTPVSFDYLKELYLRGVVDGQRELHREQAKASEAKVPVKKGAPKKR